MNFLLHVSADTIPAMTEESSDSIHLPTLHSGHPNTGFQKETSLYFSESTISAYSSIFISSLFILPGNLPSPRKIIL